MRFDVVSLAFALAAPAMGEMVGWKAGHAPSDGLLQEWDPTSTIVSAEAAVPAVTSPPAVPDTSSNKAADSNSADSGMDASAEAANTTPAPTTTAVSGKGQNAVSNKKATAESTAAQATIKASKTSAAKTSAAKPSAAKTSAAATASSDGGSSSGKGGSAPAGGQILYIVNKYGEALDVIDGSSGGAPAQGVPSNPANGATATVTLSSGWAGRFALNPSGVPAGNQDGTKIEGSISSGTGFWDISLVDGYTVPITCTCDSETTPFIGCNIDLFKQSAKCPSPNGDKLCENPARSKNTGPADPWFAACKDADYTYPQNDIATQTCSKSKMTCCVGSSCAKGKAQAKRSINPVYARWAFPRSAFADEE